MVKRKDAIFKDSSRLYRQAEQGAEALLEVAHSSRDYFRDTLQFLVSKKIAPLLGTRSERANVLAGSFDYLSATASSVDPRYGIPLLMAAMDRYYYQEKTKFEQSGWIGIGLKTAIALIAKNPNSVAARARSIERLAKLVKAAGAYEILQLSVTQADIFNFTDPEIDEFGVGVSSPADGLIAGEWNELFRQRGELQRTLNDSKKVIWSDLEKFVAASRAVLEGADPSAIALFQGTLFSFIRTREFWLGLLLRVVLLASAQRIKSPVNAEIFGIALFEEFPVVLEDFGIDPVEVQTAINRLFWTPDWYLRRVSNSRSNMIVERPAIRLDGRTFVTTPLAIMDSINCFVEHSVMGYHGLGGVPIDKDDVFRRAISAPFEGRVIAMFMSAGWDASSVTADGFWSAGNRTFADVGSACPGEIDVLARDPSGNAYLLCECKVLADPVMPSTLRNVVSKLGASDSERFHSKLSKKKEWLESVKGFENATIIPMLVVDRGAFLAKEAPHLVFDFQDLELRLAEISRVLASSSV